MMKWTFALVLAGCVQPQQPAPLYTQPGYQGYGQNGPAPAPAPEQAPPPVPTGSGDTPIDPTRDMPAGSLSTNATLTLEHPATVLADGRADVYSSGMRAPDQGRGGVLPAIVTLAPGGGYLTFSKVVGKTGCDAGTPAAGPDGGSCAGGNTDLTSADSASGIIDHQHSQFLVGVFLADRPAPPARILDFSQNALGENFAELSPALGQTFFIGDGMTSSGLAQRFNIPAGATRLYLGYADGYGFQGAPGAYGDNKGGQQATLVQHAK